MPLTRSGAQIGIGGAVTRPPLPHHRTCGSAYGGSVSTAKRGPEFQTRSPSVACRSTEIRFGFTVFCLCKTQPKLMGWHKATDEFKVLLFTLTVWAFPTCVSTTPAADFCCRIRMNYFILSHESETCSRSPVISSTAFNTQPLDLPPVSLMDMGFAISC